MVRYYKTKEDQKRNEKLLIDTMNKRDESSTTLFETEKILKILERTRQERMRELEVINEEIENELTKKNNLENEVKSLDESLRKMKEIDENTIIISVIVVFDENTNYNLTNGLVDANRDIVVKLLKIIRNKNTIREVVGMANVFYSWSKQQISRWAPPPYGFNADASGLVSLSRNQCSFNTKAESHSVFVSNLIITKDIHKIAFKVFKLDISDCSYKDSNAVMVGVCSQFTRDKVKNTHLGAFAGPGSGGINIYGHSICLIGYPGRWGPDLSRYSPVCAGSVISVEFNGTEHTVHFFVNGTLFTEYFTNTPHEPMVFAASGYNTPVIEINSLTRLSKSTVLAKSKLTARPFCI